MNTYIVDRQWGFGPDRYSGNRYGYPSLFRIVHSLKNWKYLPRDSSPGKHVWPKKSLTVRTVHLSQKVWPQLMIVGLTKISLQIEHWNWFSIKFFKLSVFSKDRLLSLLLFGFIFFILRSYFLVILSSFDQILILLDKILRITWLPGNSFISIGCQT